MPSLAISSTESTQNLTGHPPAFSIGETKLPHEDGRHSARSFPPANNNEVNGEGGLGGGGGGGGGWGGGGPGGGGGGGGGGQSGIRGRMCVTGGWAPEEMAKGGLGDIWD